MRYPNLRYGNPTEFAYYAMGRPLKDLAKSLRRDERTVRDWLSGRARVPWWVPEIMRLRRMELELRQRQMFGHLESVRNAKRLGVVLPNNVLELRSRGETKKAPDRDQGLFVERRAVAR